MSIQVTELDPGTEPSWEQVAGGVSPRFAYASLVYRDFLACLLPSGTARYLVAKDGDDLVGLLPVFVDRSDLGSVVMSLPFHCSNGGVVHGEGDTRAATALVEGFVQLAAEERAISSSLVTSPFAGSDDLHRMLFPHTFEDARIGQWTALPPETSQLWDRLHGKTRNAVRKAQRSGVTVRAAAAESDWDEMLDLHQRNMARLGAEPKSRRTIDLIRSSFVAPGSHDLWVAEHEGSVVAAVLNVEALGTVEYFVPTFDESRKDLQALTLTVWTALDDAIERGHHTFNWGGTRPGQDGVHRFKSRWGAEEQPYTVLTQLHDATVLRRSRAELLSAHPHSFVVPFDALMG